MLRRVRTRHELHYVAFSNDASGEGVKRSVEYCDHAYPIPHHLPTRRSPAFAVQLVQGMFSPLPLAVFRYQSQRMRSAIDDLLARYKFDIIVCDFIFPAPNLRALHGAVLFQHNVETMIWRRHAETAKNPVERLYFSGQARKMFRYESSVCQAARHVIGVSPADAESMRSLFGLKEVSAVATGVDVDYFTPNGVPRQPVADLIFVGSMDWLPNIDGVQYFHTSVLPLIRRERPNCSVAIVGRYPPREILALAQADPLIQVTGTVPDVRPFLHGARVSIVPLRIGG
jgi:glycosyltransferase involved in cell wall biosynthesis